MKASDAVIRRFDKDIPDSIRGDADFYFVKERWCVPDTPSKWRLNTGVYVMRNCPSSRQLLDAAISRREYINHEWWDQAAISAVLGYWSVFFRPEEHRADEPTEISKRIGWLHSEWNASPVYDPVPNAIIRHFYGLRGNGKKAAMMIDAIADGRAEGSSSSAPVTIGRSSNSWSHHCVRGFSADRMRS